MGASPSLLNSQRLALLASREGEALWYLVGLVVVKAQTVTKEKLN